MYIYIYIFVCIYIYIHECICVVYMCIYIYIYSYWCTGAIYAYVCICISLHTHIYIYIYIYICIHMYMYIYIYIHICIYISTYIIHSYLKIGALAARRARQERPWNFSLQRSIRSKMPQTKRLSRSHATNGVSLSLSVSLHPKPPLPGNLFVTILAVYFDSTEMVLLCPFLACKK